MRSDAVAIGWTSWPMKARYERMLSVQVPLSTNECSYIDAMQVALVYECPGIRSCFHMGTTHRGDCVLPSLHA